MVGLLVRSSQRHAETNRFNASDVFTTHVPSGSWKGTFVRQMIIFCFTAYAGSHGCGAGEECATSVLRSLGEGEHTSARCRRRTNRDHGCQAVGLHGRTSEGKTMEEGSTGLSIGFSTMLDTIDDDPFRGIVDLIEDAIRPDSQAMASATR